MKAGVGDQIIILSSSDRAPTRHGVIVDLHHSDGTPPFVVEWDDGHRALIYPGSDAKITHVGGVDHPDTAHTVPGAVATTELPHVKRWRVDVDIFESGDETDAHAVLTSEAPHHLDARGVARRNPVDLSVPEIGDEVAVARALRQLADHLLRTASDDIAGVEGKDVTLST